MTRLINTNPGYTDMLFSTNIDLKGKLTTGPLTHTFLVGWDHFNYYTPTQLAYSSVAAAPFEHICAEQL